MLCGKSLIFSNNKGIAIAAKLSNDIAFQINCFYIVEHYQMLPTATGRVAGLILENVRNISFQMTGIEPV